MVKCAIIPPSATTNGPFSFSSACPLLSFLFVLSHTSSNVSDCINFSPSSPLSNLSSSTAAPTLHHPFLLCSPSPLLSLPLPSINIFLLPHLLLFLIQFFNLVCSQMCARACALSLIFPLFLSSPVSPALTVSVHLIQSTSFVPILGTR